MTIDPLVLLQAYAIGVFPMSDDREAQEIYWIEPKRRAILPLGHFHLSHSLARTIRPGRTGSTASANTPSTGGLLVRCVQVRPPSSER